MNRLRSPNAQSAKEVLPADLDVTFWLDIARLRGLWSVKPNLQIATILSEYGLFAPSAESGFWLQLVSQADKLWIACRPNPNGCVDPVVFARGRFNRPDPVALMPDLERPLDLGAGWFRFDRQGLLSRTHTSRIYFAPPDRLVAVSLAEVDAVERSLERGSNESSLQIDERGLFSMSFRGSAVARVLQERAPAAARFIRDASVVRLWLDNATDSLKLSVVIAFGVPERAERARQAFLLIAGGLDWIASNRGSSAFAAEVVGGDLVLHLELAAPKRTQTEGVENLKPAKQ